MQRTVGEKQEKDLLFICCIGLFRVFQLLIFKKVNFIYTIVSLGMIWIRIVSLGMIRIRIVSLGMIRIRIGSLGMIRIRIGSLGMIRIRIVSLGMIRSADWE